MEKESTEKLTLSQRIKRQQMLEIWLPVVISIIVCLAVLVLVIVASKPGGDSVSKIADIAVIMMIIPLFLIFFVTIALVLLLAFGMKTLNGKLPSFFNKVQTITSNITTRIQAFAGIISLPIIKIRSLAAGSKLLISSTGNAIMNRRKNE